MQDECSVVNLAYAYATTSGVLRKAAILRHPVGRSDREMECAGGVEYQRGRAAVRQALVNEMTSLRDELDRKINEARPQTPACFPENVHSALTLILQRAQIKSFSTVRRQGA